MSKEAFKKIATGLKEALTFAQVEAQRDEARQIVRDIHWMARRYADGRYSYAPGMFNDAIRKAVDAGWLQEPSNGESLYAAEGKFPSTQEYSEFTCLMVDERKGE